MSIRMLALSVIATLALAIPAAAEEGPDYAQTGAYLGAGLALGWDNYRALGGGTSALDTGVGFDAWGGYRFARNFAAELEIQYIDRLDLGGIDISEVMNFSGNLKAYLCDCRFQPFALVGVGLSWVDIAGVSTQDFGARFGAGFDLYATENLSFTTTGSYVLNTGNLDEIDWISLVMGLQYKF